MPLVDRVLIVGTGFNQRKSHPHLNKTYGHYGIHAECAAILNAKGRGDTIIVVRIRSDNVLAISKPCKKCAKYIQDCGIKNVMYIDQNGDILKEKARNLT